MKSLIVIACLLCAATAAPAPEPATDIDLVTVPLKDNKELDIITLAGDDGLINERNKRTIGILRQMFPTLSQIMDQKIQMLTSVLFRTIGPIILRSGLGGGGAGGGSNTNSSFDDDDDDDDDDDKKQSASRSGSRVRVSLPTFPPDEDEDEDEEENSVSQRNPVATSSASTTATNAVTEPTRIDLLSDNSLGREKGARALNLDLYSELPKEPTSDAVTTPTV